MRTVTACGCIAFALPALGAAFIAPAHAPIGGRAVAHSAAMGVRSAGSVAVATPRLRAPLSRQGLAGLRCAVGFDTWLAENGGKTACSTSPTGLVAGKDLKAGEEACSVSLKACLTASSARAAFGSTADTVDSETAIALQLLLEKSKGSGSAWAPWLATLPDRDTLDLPYFWPQADKELLQGTSVLDAVEQNEEAYQEEFEQLVRQGWGAKFPDGVFTLQNYEWAVELVTSRAVCSDKVEGNYVLAPFVDAVNTPRPPPKSH
jgi:hypothetical protein